VLNFYSAPVGVPSIVINPSVCVCMTVCVCLSVSISLVPLDQWSQNLLCRSHEAVVQSSSGGIVIRYVLPVWCMTSCLAIMDRMVKHGGCTTIQRLITSSIAIPGWSLMSVNACFNCNQSLVAASKFKFRMAVYLCYLLKPKLQIWCQFKLENIVLPSEMAFSTFVLKPSFSQSLSFHSYLL